LRTPPRQFAHTTAARFAATNKRMMWVTPGRVFYCGLLGEPSLRRIGGYIIYLAQGAPLQIRLADDRWQTCDLAVVPPYQPHRITCDARLIVDVIIEPETVEPASLPPFLRNVAGAILDAGSVLRQLRKAQARLEVHDGVLPADDDLFDEIVFGAPLPRRCLDDRIFRALSELDRRIGEQVSAEELANLLQLSFSRFIHLFKDEVGVPLRTFQNWKRARSLLNYVTQDANLADIAQQTGYPDAAHFSHSIRRVFGLQPREMFAGSRRLSLHAKPCDSSFFRQRR
jgi:AraC-like DNA-binding protein